MKSLRLAEKARFRKKTKDLNKIARGVAKKRSRPKHDWDPTLMKCLQEDDPIGSEED